MFDISAKVSLFPRILRSLNLPRSSSGSCLLTHHGPPAGLCAATFLNSRRTLLPVEVAGEQKQRYSSEKRWRLARQPSPKQKRGEQPLLTDSPGDPSGDFSPPCRKR